jgi:uncharacterized small protein (DUF1192 family)
MDNELDAIEKKLECLAEIGVRAAPVRAEIARIRALLKKKQTGQAAKRIEETMVLFKIASAEIEAVFEKLSGGKDSTPESGKAPPPSLKEISETVEEAFKRHLHSTSLRRMVEVIALEKIRSILQDEVIPESWLERVVKQTVAEIKSGRNQVR